MDGFRHVGDEGWAARAPNVGAPAVIRVARVGCFAIAACCAVAVVIYLLAYGECDPTTCQDHRSTVAVVLGIPFVVFGIAGLRLIGWEERHPPKE